MSSSCCEVPPPSPDSSYRRVLVIALAANVVMFCVEVAASVFSGSSALAADAADFLGDAANYALSLGALAPAILGVILFITGGQLALGSCDFSKDKAERFATLVTAAFAIWNVGIAFIAGFLLCLAARRRLLRL